MSNLFETLGNAINPFPANPLKVFSIVERLRTRLNGNTLFELFVKDCIELQKTLENPDYWVIIKEVKEMAQDAGAVRMCKILGADLYKDLIEIELPDFYKPKK